MGEKLEKIILEYKPEYWQGYGDRVEVHRGSKEYDEISNEVLDAMLNRKLITKIERHQNIHHFGQFLVREQQLVFLNPNMTYYRVHRYVNLQRQYLSAALQYNLDYRRCNMQNLKLQKNISVVNPDDVLLVVQTVTTDLFSSAITPARTADYFIDYIVEF